MEITFHALNFNPSFLINSLVKKADAKKKWLESLEWVQTIFSSLLFLAMLIALSDRFTKIEI